MWPRGGGYRVANETGKERRLQRWIDLGFSRADAVRQVAWERERRVVQARDAKARPTQIAKRLDISVPRVRQLEDFGRSLWARKRAPVEIEFSEAAVQVAIRDMVQRAHRDKTPSQARRTTNLTALKRRLTKEAQERVDQWMRERARGRL